VIAARSEADKRTISPPQESLMVRRLVFRSSSQSSARHLKSPKIDKNDKNAQIELNENN